jgi:hypothetical protein
MRVFLAVLVALIAVSACRRAAETGVAVPPNLAAYVPASTTVLAGADLGQLKRASLYQRHQDQIKWNALNSLTERTGIDIRRDVSNLLVAWTPPNQPAVIASGHFSRSPNPALFFPKPGILIAGPPELRNENHGVIPAPLGERLHNLAHADQLWLVSSQSLPVSHIPLRPDFSSNLMNLAAFVNSLNAGLALSDGAHFEADLNCVSVPGAKQVHDALRGGIGIARLTTKDDEVDLLHAYDAIQVDQDGQTVRIRADWPPALADQVLNRLAK